MKINPYLLVVILILIAAALTNPDSATIKDELYLEIWKDSVFAEEGVEDFGLKIGIQRSVTVNDYVIFSVVKLNKPSMPSFHGRVLAFGFLKQVVFSGNVRQYWTLISFP